MRIKAMAFRILNQIRRDKRTLALVLLAPLFLVTLLYLILDANTTNYQVGIINAPQSYIERLYENNIHTVRVSAETGLALLKEGKITAAIDIASGKSYIQVDGSQFLKVSAVLNALEAAKRSGSEESRPDLRSEIEYIYGSADLSLFDHFGSTLIGIVVFFFVFLLSGISFLQERTTGTLEKVLSTPIRRWEIVAGYAAGYGSIALIQSALVTLFVVYVLDVMMAGSFWLVLLLTLLSALAALTLGTLLSGAAASELQMIQFIPIVILPQVFFSGLFNLSPAFSAIGKIMPLYYVADGLNKVMIRGEGFTAILLDIGVLMTFSLLCMLGNTRLLKKYRQV